MQLLPEYFAPEPGEGLLSCQLADRNITTGFLASDHSQSPPCSLPFFHSAENTVLVNFIFIGSATLLKNVMYVHISPSATEVTGNY